MAEGHSVLVVHYDQELTTQQAADLPPTFVMTQNRVVSVARSIG